MDDAVLVRVRQGVRHLLPVAQHLLDRQRPLASRALSDCPSTSSMAM